MFHGRKVRSKHFSILALCNLQKKATLLDYSIFHIYVLGA